MEESFEEEIVDQEEILLVINKILATRSDKKKEISNFVKHKLPLIIDKELKAIELKDELRAQIDTCITRIFTQHRGFFMFNSALNSYYMVSDNENNTTLQLVSSDQIALKLSKYIPTTLQYYKLTILKSIVNNFKKESIFQWTPPYTILNTIEQHISILFNNCNKQASNFMYVVGAIILKNDSIFSNIIHIWYGEYAAKVIEIIQLIVSQITQSYAPLWSRIRSKMHYSYPINTVSLLYFDSNYDWSKWIEKLNNIKEDFIVSCCHIFKTKKYTDLTFPRNHSFINTDCIWKEYRQQLLTETDTEYHNYVNIEEIIQDFNVFLKNTHLPKNSLTTTDIKRYSDLNFYYTKHRINAQTIYSIKLNTPTCHDLFVTFCKTILRHDSENDTISTGRLYDTFEAWISISYKNDFSISAQSICPYNMFDAFLHQTYKPTSDGKWNLIVYTNVNMIKYYIYMYDQALKLSTNKSNRDFHSFKKWCIRKYGSLNMDIKNDIETEINDELITYFKQN